jgi:hypothetical protein
LPTIRVYSDNLETIQRIEAPEKPTTTPYAMITTSSPRSSPPD